MKFSIRYWPKFSAFVEAISVEADSEEEAELLVQEILEEQEPAICRQDDEVK